MATTARPQAPSRRSARASDGDRDLDIERDAEQQYDLLTAAVIGVLVGVGATLLIRRGPGGRRPVGSLVRVASTGARRAGGAAADAARWAGRGRFRRRRGMRRWIDLPLDDIADDVRDALGGVRDAVTDVVATELGELRKSIRKSRKRFGI